MPPSIGKQIFKGAAIVSLFTLLVKAMGIVQKMVMADRFGTSIEADAFTYVFSSIVFTYWIIPHKLLSPFLPLFTEKKTKEGEDSAWRFAGNVGAFVIIVMGIAVALGVATAPQLVHLTSSFQSEATSALASRLLRIMLPSALFMGVFWLLALIMHAHKRFAPPALGEAVNKFSIIFLMIALYGTMGIRGLALGVVVGGASAMLIQVIGLRTKLRVSAFVPRFGDPDLKRLGRLMLPILLGIVSSQISRTILDFWFVSRMGPGYTSSLGYAKGLADALMLLGPFAVGTVIYPFFSDLSAEGDPGRITNTLMTSLRLMALFFIPLSIGLLVLRTPFVRLMFERGEFDLHSVRLTTGPLLFYSLGLTAFALEILLMRFYLSMKDTLTPVLVGIGCVFLHIAVVLTLRHTLRHSSIALAYAVSKSVKVAVLFLLLQRKLPSLQTKQNLVFLAKTGLAATLMAMVVIVLDRRLAAVLELPLEPGELRETLTLVLRLGASCGAGLVVFAASIFSMKSAEARLMLRHIMKHRSST